MSTVISVENVSKQYRLGLIGGATLREEIQRWWARRLGRPDPLVKIGQAVPSGRDRGTFWALRDVSFQVRQGEILGVIGRNGAGKSTLLKILSQITSPTAGRIRLKGRVGSLLEVGTGFHPELTGRENTYMNGAILGMSRMEIARKFDEIVDFAEVGGFIDTPVKRYSSGMYVRLAFAVAAHLEPEILVVDEVLAVGDSGFQEKCLGKMSAVAGAGRTVVFVSHNMAAVTTLCERAVVLDGGRLVIDSSPEQAVSAYLHARSKTLAADLSERSDRQGDGRIRFTRVWVGNRGGEPTDVVVTGQDITIVAEYEAQGEMPTGPLSVSFALRGPLGEAIGDLSSDVAGHVWTRPPRKGRVICHVGRLPLLPGQYTFNVWGGVNCRPSDWVWEAGRILVEAGDFFGSGKLPDRANGCMVVGQSWSLVAVPLSR